MTAIECLIAYEAEIGRWGKYTNGCIYFAERLFVHTDFVDEHSVAMTDHNERREFYSEADRDTFIKLRAMEKVMELFDNVTD